MTVSMFVILLSVMSTLTGLVVEGAKKILDEKNYLYSSNALACIVGVIIGAFGTCGYYILLDVAVTAQNTVCMILMGFMVALSSMVGYDKVIQLIRQFET